MLLWKVVCKCKEKNNYVQTALVYVRIFIRILWSIINFNCRSLDYWLLRVLLLLRCCWLAWVSAACRYVARIDYIIYTLRVELCAFIASVLRWGVPCIYSYVYICMFHFSGCRIDAPRMSENARVLLQQKFLHDRRHWYGNTAVRDNS